MNDSELFDMYVAYITPAGVLFVTNMAEGVLENCTGRSDALPLAIKVINRVLFSLWELYLCSNDDLRFSYVQCLRCFTYLHNNSLMQLFCVAE